MANTDHFATMRATLVPKGTLPVVRIGDMFMDAEFIQQCINDAERACNFTRIGMEPTPLERLAMHVLCKAADIKMG